jgi:hypothetical protein
MQVYAKWKSLLDNKLKLQVECFRGCRLLNPAFVASRTVDFLITEVQYLCLIPSLKKKSNAIIEEMTLYKNLCDGIESNCELFDFWKSHEQDLPTLCDAVHEAVLLQPSSGTAERAFSMLEWMFSSFQTNLLEDGKEAGVMLRYNNGQRKKQK